MAGTARLSKVKRPASKAAQNPYLSIKPELPLVPTRSSPGIPALDVMEVLPFEGPDGLPQAPAPEAIARSMEDVYTRLDAANPTAGQAMTQQFARTSWLMPGMKDLLGHGPSTSGRVENFRNGRDLFDFYIANHQRGDLGVYTGEVLLGVDSGRGGIDSINPQRRGFVSVRLRGGRPDAKFPYNFSAIKSWSNDGREIGKPIIDLGAEPWAVAAKYQPSLFKRLKTIAWVVNHDVTMHALMHPSQKKDAGDGPSSFRAKLPNNYIEPDSQLGHFAVMQDLFRRKPAVRERLIAQAVRFEEEVGQMTAQYERALRRSLIRKATTDQARCEARETARAQASAIGDYYLDVYFNKNLLFILAPEHCPELREILGRHPFLEEIRPQDTKDLVAAYDGRTRAYQDESLAAMLADYRVEVADVCAHSPREAQRRHLLEKQGMDLADVRAQGGVVRAPVGHEWAAVRGGLAGRNDAPGLCALAAAAPKGFRLDLAELVRRADRIRDDPAVHSSIREDAFARLAPLAAELFKKSFIRRGLSYDVMLEYWSAKPRAVILELPGEAFDAAPGQAVAALLVGMSKDAISVANPETGSVRTFSRERFLRLFHLSPHGSRLIGVDLDEVRWRDMLPADRGEHLGDGSVYRAFEAKDESPFWSDREQVEDELRRVDGRGLSSLFSEAKGRSLSPEVRELIDKVARSLDPASEAWWTGWFFRTAHGLIGDEAVPDGLEGAWRQTYLASALVEGAAVNGPAILDQVARFQASFEAFGSKLFDKLRSARALWEDPALMKWALSFGDEAQRGELLYESLYKRDLTPDVTKLLADEAVRSLDGPHEENAWAVLTRLGNLQAHRAPLIERYLQAFCRSRAEGVLSLMEQDPSIGKEIAEAVRSACQSPSCDEAVRLLGYVPTHPAITAAVVDALTGERGAEWMDAVAPSASRSKRKRFWRAVAEALPEESAERREQVKHVVSTIVRIEEEEDRRRRRRRRR